MDTAVNWAKIGEAVEWYKSIGYEYLEVPWIVGDEAYKGTAPPWVEDYKTLGGNLVASGEQSFMQMLAEGKKIGKAVCCTPCFRADGNDEYHKQYFVKVELINTDVTDENLKSMIWDARYFLESRYPLFNCGLVKFFDGTYDLTGMVLGTELGSYGIREWQGHKWIYGTGLAEPRASQVQLEEAAHYDAQVSEKE